MGEPDHTPAEELADPMPSLVRSPAESRRCGTTRLARGTNNNKRRDRRNGGKIQLTTPSTKSPAERRPPSRPLPQSPKSTAERRHPVLPLNSLEDPSREAACEPSLTSDSMASSQRRRGTGAASACAVGGCLAGRVWTDHTGQSSTSASCDESNRRRYTDEVRASGHGAKSRSEVHVRRVTHGGQG